MVLMALTRAQTLIQRKSRAGAHWRKARQHQSKHSAIHSQTGLPIFQQAWSLHLLSLHYMPSVHTLQRFTIRVLKKILLCLPYISTKPTGVKLQFSVFSSLEPCFDTASPSTPSPHSSWAASSDGSKAEPGHRLKTGSSKGPLLLATYCSVR